MWHKVIEKKLDLRDFGDEGEESEMTWRPAAWETCEMIRRKTGKME